MESDGSIDVDASCAPDNVIEENSPAAIDAIQSEAHREGTTSPEQEGISIGDHVGTFIRNDGTNGNQHMQEMDLEFDTKQKQPMLQESIELSESVMTLEKVKDVEPGPNGESAHAVSPTNNMVSQFMTDESPIAGVKRARMTSDEQQPFVHVVYNSLTRESKRKLMELMQQWSEWHSQSQSSCDGSSKQVLEHGEETYFPALHVGSEKSSTISFWLDNQGRKEEITHIRFESDAVPLYDRGYSLGSASLEGSAYPESSWTEALEASRCFNCGSYSHSLKDCPKPRDTSAINNARKLHHSKRKPAAFFNGQVRYYQKSAGKFDDLKAGVIGHETRECLGIGELDPPPWLHRMRELGYPPGYLDVEEDQDQPSGITIFAGEETKVEYEEGELPERGEPQPSERRMTVEFPGLNAPLPDYADHWLWATQPAATPGSSFGSRSHHRSHRFSESHRGHSNDQRWSSGSQDICPPGTEHGSASSMQVYPPRYDPYDHDSSARSPILERSLSEKGWRSPLPYESSLGHSPRSPYPYPPPGVDRHSSRYHSSAPSVEDWKQEEEILSPRDRHDYRRHHSRN